MATVKTLTVDLARIEHLWQDALSLLEVQGHNPQLFHHKHASRINNTHRDAHDTIVSEFWWMEHVGKWRYSRNTQ